MAAERLAARNVDLREENLQPNKPMSAYLIELRFIVDRFGGAHSWLTVRSPLWKKDQSVSITAECVTPLELETWGEKAKDQIDRAVREGKRKFAANEKKQRGLP